MYDCRPSEREVHPDDYGSRRAPRVIVGRSVHHQHAGLRYLQPGGHVLRGADQYAVRSRPRHRLLLHGPHPGHRLLFRSGLGEFHLPGAWEPPHGRGGKNGRRRFLLFVHHGLPDCRGRFLPDGSPAPLPRIDGYHSPLCQGLLPFHPYGHAVHHVLLHDEQPDAAPGKCPPVYDRHSLRSRSQRSPGPDSDFRLRSGHPGRRPGDGHLTSGEFHHHAVHLRKERGYQNPLWKLPSILEYLSGNQRRRPPFPGPAGIDERRRHLSEPDSCRLW